MKRTKKEARIGPSLGVELWYKNMRKQIVHSKEFSQINGPEHFMDFICFQEGTVLKGQQKIIF